MKKKAPAKASRVSPRVTTAEPAPIFIRWRFYLLLFFVLTAFCALVARVAYIQIIET